jgi:hypothetical protein
MARAQAIAEGGPPEIAGDPNLYVESLAERGDCGEWPCEQVWTAPPRRRAGKGHLLKATGPGERHLYRFKTVAVGPPTGGQPVYEHVRKLGEDD